MKEYIEKEAAVNFAVRGYLCIADALGEEPNESNCFAQIAEIRDFLRNLPPADAKPVVRGRWTEIDRDVMGEKPICATSAEARRMVTPSRNSVKTAARI